jgi:hypothetical protein
MLALGHHLIVAGTCQQTVSRRERQTQKQELTIPMNYDSITINCVLQDDAA